MKKPAKKLTPKQAADKRYNAKVFRKKVIFNVENKNERDILAAFDNSGLEFSTLCKQLLAEHYELPTT